MLKQYARISLLIFTLAIILCGIYPLVVTVIGKTLFASKVQGQIIERKGKAIGSALIGQKFSRPEYLVGRPSFAGESYDALKSGGSNFAIGGAKFMQQVGQEVAYQRQLNPMENATLVPIDLVTGSASGLDPHVSMEGAFFQAQRLAQVRKIHIEDVKEVFTHHQEHRLLHFFGEETINVLGVNLELDEKFPLK